MEEAAVFDQLVRELDDQERRALLVRLQGSVPPHSENLSPREEEGPSEFTAERELENLHLLQRLVLFLRALFSGKDRDTLLRERYLKRLGAHIQQAFPDLISLSDGHCRSALQRELSELKTHARSLFAPLDEAIGENRRQFLAFLARSDLRDFQERLVAQTDPRQIWENGEFSEEKQIRRLMLSRFDGLVAALPKSEVAKAGQDAGALFALYDFARHPFEELLAPFAADRESEVAFTELLGPLKSLDECLEPVRLSPSPQALYDLFLFLYQELLEEEDFDLESRLVEDMALFNSALSGIRRFRQRVPLLSLIRLFARDPSYRPSANAPADWFPFFKDFWRSWVKQRYLRFYNTRRRSTLIAEALTILAVPSLPALENYRDDKFGADTPVRHQLSLSFIKGFLREVFLPLSRSLKLIYINGEFYKEENRHAFTDAFLFLGGGEEKIGALEATLGPQGELRAAVQEVKAQALGRRLRRKRILDIIARADKQAKILVDSFAEQIESLKSLLYGILKGQPGDRYDTLVNLERIGGPENVQLRKAWTHFLGKADQAAVLLRNIRDLESS